MKGYINVIDRDLRYIPTEELVTLERDTRSGLSVKYNNQWIQVDNYIHFDNGLYISWIHVTPSEWKTAKFLYQEDNKLFLDWNDSMLQNYFSHLFHDMNKVIHLVDKNRLWFTNSEIDMLINNLNSLK